MRATRKAMTREKQEAIPQTLQLMIAMMKQIYRQNEERAQESLRMQEELRREIEVAKKMSDESINQFKCKISFEEGMKSRKIYRVFQWIRLNSLTSKQVQLRRHVEMMRTTFGNKVLNELYMYIIKSLLVNAICICVNVIIDCDTTRHMTRYLKFSRLYTVKYINI